MVKTKNNKNIGNCSCSDCHDKCNVSQQNAEKTNSKISREDMEKELQKKYMQHQLLRQQLYAFMEERVMIETKINELSETINAIKKLDDVKKDQEIWCSLGSKTFVHTDVKDIDNIAVELGAGIFGKKTREEAVEILTKRMDELIAVNKEIMTEINRMGEQLSYLEPEIQHLASMLQ